MSDENDPLAILFRKPSDPKPSAPKPVESSPSVSAPQILPDQEQVLTALLGQLADIEKQFGSEEALAKASAEEKMALLAQLKDVQDAINAMNKIH